jgi:hypothetical protein
VRLGAAGLALGAGLAGAAILRAVVNAHRQIDCPKGPNPLGACVIVPAHDWVNPAALGLALLGIAAASGLLLAVVLGEVQRRRAGAAAILGLGAGLVVWVATYREVVPADFRTSSAIRTRSRAV